LNFLEIGKVDSWVDKILPAYLKLTETQRMKVFATLSDVNVGIKSLEDGASKTAHGDTKAQLKIKVKEALEGLTNGAVTLPAIKN
jgi:hypothetical protein